jgi:undecaprenyl-diphosphatase
LVVAAVSGYLAVAWLLRFLRTRTTYGFVVYRVVLGLFLIATVVGAAVR